MSTKPCPFCAEEIQEHAIKCKHCGEFLDNKSTVERIETGLQHVSEYCMNCGKPLLQESNACRWCGNSNAAMSLAAPERSSQVNPAQQYVAASQSDKATNTLIGLIIVVAFLIFVLHYC